MYLLLKKDKKLYFLNIYQAFQALNKCILILVEFLNSGI